MNFRSALESDLNTIEVMLKESELPYEDCKHHLHNFIVLEEDSEILGIGGFERYDDVALLRSVAVNGLYRSKGLGASIVFKIKECLEEQGVKTVYLLTETAADYFKKFNFEQVNRDMVPQTIRQTAQFSSLCPPSAVVMKCV